MSNRPNHIIKLKLSDNSLHDLYMYLTTEINRTDSFFPYDAAQEVVNQIDKQFGKPKRLGG